MTKFKKKILIVDDQVINRMLLRKILGDKYDLFEADGGEKALEIVRENKDVLQVILLDLVMPGMDGYTFLEIVKEDPELRNIPIIVTTQSEGVEAEIKALELGASDYITKPYNNIVILQRVTNIIAFRENAILRNTAERDPLTALYNKHTFHTKVNELIVSNPNTEYVILYMDIERFKMINDFFGEKEGDKLLIYVGQILAGYSDAKEILSCRYSADIFVICMPHDTVRINTMINKIIELIDNYPLNFKITVDFGIYVIDDIDVPVHVMCDRASLALENVVGKYDCHYAYYNSSHLAKLKEEQDITNDMSLALKEEQFQVYLQPKFDMTDFSIVGAEALVRWIHPTKGFIGPDKFIPVFESNGFITELDMYIWEKTCICLRKWLDNGWPAIPVSVNVSRVDIYRPDICDVFSNLIKKYNLPYHLFELEITETSYTQNADQLIATVSELKRRGFSLSMDDFGSGYSSLNMLKEVPVDVLKIDMKLLKNLDLLNKNNNIINFVVSMAKWLNLSVISEGVETMEQVSFLRSIGCNTGQGYFFSRPLPIAQFEELLLNHKKEEIAQEEDYSTFVTVEDIWDLNSEFSVFFDSFLGAFVLFEYSQNNLRFIRANDEFYQKVIPNAKDCGIDLNDYISLVHVLDKSRVMENVSSVCALKQEAYFEYRVNLPYTSKERWQKMDLKVLHSTKTENILLASIDDITNIKTIEQNYLNYQKRTNEVLFDNSISIFEIDFEKELLIPDEISKKQYDLPDVIEDPAAFFTSGNFISKADKAETRDFFSALFQALPNSDLNLECRKKDQNIVSTKLTCRIDSNGAGSLPSGYCVLQDI